MQQIEIDFEVFKALTNLRESESHTYNEVLRDLLKLEKTFGRRISEQMGGFAKGFALASAQGFMASGRLLPSGSLLRAKYKGVAYNASIIDGTWTDEDGNNHGSASAAARAITQTNVNGLTFWEVKRPSDAEWRKLDALPKTPS